MISGKKVVGFYHDLGREHQSTYGIDGNHLLNEDQAGGSEFVESFPPEFDEGVLYVSIPFAMVGHLCACECRRKVVTP